MKFAPRTSPAIILAAILTSFGSCVLWAAANDPFIGDWKLNPSRSKLTDVMKVASLGANKYTFNFGSGPETTVVDGTDQPGHFGSTLSVAVQESGNWKVIRKRNGRTLLTAIWNLSQDGSTLTDNFTSVSPDGSTSNVNYVYNRKGAGSGFVGEWVSTTATVNSNVTLQVQPFENGLSFTDPSGQVTRSVKFDGKDYPNLGSGATPGSTSSMQRVSERTLEMIYKINGQILYTQHIELSSDLKTLTMTRLIVGESEPNIKVFERQ
jgi:hypothetical protein